MVTTPALGQHGFRGLPYYLAMRRKGERGPSELRGSWPVAYRFNPPPGWPVSADFVPAPDWRPDPSWPPVPPGWPLWVDDSVPGDGLPTAPPVQYPYQAYTYGAPPPRRGTNGFAITAFVLGLIGGTILSIIFGIIGLVQIRRTGQRGRGLAIAGITLACVWLVIFIGIFASGGLSVKPSSGGSATSATGPIHSTQRINIFSLKPGDCFQNPPASQTILGVTDVTAVPCTVAHNAQAFAQFDATNPSYPGSSALIRQAQSGCQSRESVLNGSALTSTMRLHFLYPLQTSWAAGKRTITCLVVDKTKDLTSSLLSG
jgi:hypothetical protein